MFNPSTSRCWSVCKHTHMMHADIYVNTFFLSEQEEKFKIDTPSAFTLWYAAAARVLVYLIRKSLSHFIKFLRLSFIKSVKCKRESDWQSFLLVCPFSHCLFSSSSSSSFNTQTLSLSHLIIFFFHFFEANMMMSEREEIFLFEILTPLWKFVLYLMTQKHTFNNENVIISHSLALFWSFMRESLKDLTSSKKI